MIRKPMFSEFKECLKLLYMSGPNMFSYFLIKQPPEIYDCLNIFYCKEDVLFSYNNVLVKVEDDRVCGLLLSVPAKEVHMLEKNMNKYGKDLLITIGFINIIKMLSRMKIQKFMSNLYDKDEYYISNLAVHENYRGQGIGIELLAKAEEIAKINGYKKLSLLVELDNSNAQRIYEKYGFKKTKTISLPKNYYKYCINGFHKMIKEI